jgi:hypothetical protein
MADEKDGEPMQPQSVEPSLEILGRKRGRPRVEQVQERVSTRLPVDNYDQLVKVARREDKSVSELVRQILLAQSFLGKR